MSTFVLTPAATADVIGHIRRDLAGSDVRFWAVFFWAVFKYLIVYHPETQPLQVVRVLHGRRDLKALLN